MHRAPEQSGDREYLDLFFAVEGWRGTPAIGEPEKCSEPVWMDQRHLPREVVDYVADVLWAISQRRPLLLHSLGS